MRILGRYIQRNIIAAIIMVLLAVLAMNLFIVGLTEVGNIGKGDYGMMQALWVSVLSLPQMAYQFFPMAGLVGCLIALGNLATSSELIVMRAAGMSITQIVIAVLIAALWLLIFVSFMGEVVAPYSLDYANEYKTKLIAEGNDIATSDWLRIDNTFLAVSYSGNRQHLNQLKWYKINDQGQLLQAGQAQSAA